MYKPDYMKISFKDKMLVSKALIKGNTSIFEPSVLNDFESKFSNKIGSKYSCILPNCTSAIFAAINCLNLETGDEIIIPNLTHSSSIYPLILSGVKIKTYEFKKDSYDADIEFLENLISKKTKAIMVCYLHGYSLNTLDISNFCKKYGLSLIEDCAQGFGIKVDGKYAGTIGDFGCYSFGASKLLRVCEGGAITCNDSKYANKINKIRHVGEFWKSNGMSTVSGGPTYFELVEKGLDYEGLAFNLRVIPYTYAYAKNKLKSIDKIICERQQKLLIYQDKFKNLDGIKFVDNINIGIKNTAPFSAWLILDSRYKLEKIISACLHYGIPVGKFKYDVISEIPFFKKFLNNKNSSSYYNSINIKARSLFLPIYENLSYRDIKNISNDFLDIIDVYNKNSSNYIFNTNILRNKIKYFNGFFMK